MKNKFWILGLIFFTSTVFAGSYSNLQKQLNRFGYSIKLPSLESLKSMNEEKSIPEEMRPIRTARTTFRIYKIEEVEKDGMISVEESILCERVIFLNVYRPDDGLTIPHRDLSRYTCFDINREDGEFKRRAVHIGGLLTEMNNVTDDDPIVGEGATKLVLTFLHVAPSQEQETHPMFYSFAGTKDLESRSHILSPRPSPYESRDLKTYYSAIIHVEDDQR